ncbi:POT family proton-dependent oligopeptide transporter [Acinetobacter calcoaceticus]|uniref:POT family proton-dependent oligopeptide transporter n=1 Tax=Acinetobacter calcoaceticus TaxID=471 RepID=A0A4R1XTV8_ACICA|nr:POT family proton-dependent oligopeptide transporter [Acinetobacter calcoaceticus]
MHRLIVTVNSVVKINNQYNCQVQPHFIEVKIMDKTPHQEDRAFFGHPRPLNSLFFTELWERFSYYGIRPLLILYMTAIVSEGGLGLDRASAAALIGLFAGSIYLMTIFGGWIADNWLGQSKSVWIGAVIIAMGHLSIALSAFLDQFFFYFGLVLIVLGTGLFKTCIAVIVGTLYSATDTRRDAGFSIFYMGINLGAFVAPLLTGLMVEQHGWHLGFGIGGIGMLISVLIFRFIAIPQMQRLNQHTDAAHAPAYDQPVVKHPHAGKIVAAFLIFVALSICIVTLGWVQINTILISSILTVGIVVIITAYFIYLIFFAGFNRQEKIQVLLCFILIMAAALFWSASEQQPTAFNIFARDYTDRMLMGFEIPTVWFQSINPIFIVLFSPVIAWVWVKLGQSNRDPSYIIKFVLALFMAAIGYIIMALASQAAMTGQGGLVSPLWMVASLFMLTIGELCLSPIGLSAMTKLSPTLIRGQIMGLWCTAIALGNLIAGLVGGEILSQSLEHFPTLFFKCVFILCIGAILLLTLHPMMKKRLQQPASN